MKFVTYEENTGQILYASSGPAESHLQNLQSGYRVGLSEEFEPIGALKNYIFVPNAMQPESGGIIVSGIAKKKDQKDWDLSAEEEANAIMAQMLRFHNLDYDDIQFIQVYLITPNSFSRLANEKSTFQCLLHTKSYDVEIDKVITSSTPFNFEFGGYSYPNRQSVVSFKIDGNSPILKKAVDAFLLDKGADFNVFSSSVIQAVCLKLSIEIANRLIESYRIAYDDLAARPIGIADAISSAIKIVLSDGVSQYFHTGNPFEMQRRVEELHPTKALQEIKNSAQEKMQIVLLNKAPSFLASSISTLKSAHLYGQYKECVVWAGAIISNIVEETLLLRLPQDSSEYKKIRSKPADVSGKEKRGNYFKLATGHTLNEYLDLITTGYPHEKGSYWRNLSKHVNCVLGQRNLLLHRKKAINSADADQAFYTTMNFVYAIAFKCPYSSMYSRDFNLKLLDDFL